MRFSYVGLLLVGVQAREFMKGPIPSQRIYCIQYILFIRAIYMVEKRKLNSSRQACPHGATLALLTGVGINTGDRADS